jgi:uncharacterized protein (DUF2132 family)
MPLQQPQNPLHGITLEQMVTQLFDTWGWEQLAEMIPLNCFSKDPSIASSLKFLRKTPWARAKLEELYLYVLPELKRATDATSTAQSPASSAESAAADTAPQSPA